MKLILFFPLKVYVRRNYPYYSFQPSSIFFFKRVQFFRNLKNDCVVKLARWNKHLSLIFYHSDGVFQKPLKNLLWFIWRNACRRHVNYLSFTFGKFFGLIGLKTVGNKSDVTHCCRQWVTSAGIPIWHPRRLLKNSEEFAIYVFIYFHLWMIK